MCIVVKNSEKSVKSDYYRVEAYCYLHLVRKILTNRDIPQVLLLLTEIGEKDSKKMGYSTSFTGFFIKITNFSTAFPKYSGNSAHFTSNS